jgi:Na+/H+ antiporter
MITDVFTIYISLLAVIVFVSLVFYRAGVPVSLLLVIAGMFLSLVPHFPPISIHSEVVLNIFLPLLLYQGGAYASWRDFKKNMRPIILLSVGHVLFVTVLIAVIMHYIIPGLSWPLAFVLGAVIAPPDDVAIIAIADKIHFPQSIVTVLKGEGLLNDATALTLFRFSLAALVSHSFHPLQAVNTFALVVVGELLYGIALGHLIGQIRLRVHDSNLQILISLITPFMAFLLPEKLGGSGVIATVTTGVVIGNYYLERMQPEVRLTSRAVWTTLEFTLQNLLFLLVGLELRFIVSRISNIPSASLLLYSTVIILTVVIGRFIWVFAGAYLPQFFMPSLRKVDPYPPWQFPFVISWAGMRGGISLAAALAVPSLTPAIDGVNPRDLLVFLVFCVIAATLLIQGLSLPWLMQTLGITRHGEREKYLEHVTELSARLVICKMVLKWLLKYSKQVEHDQRLSEEVKLRIRECKTFKKQLSDRLHRHGNDPEHDQVLESQEAAFVLLQMIEVERSVIARLWDTSRIGFSIKNKLIQQLDHREKHLSGYI